MKAEDNDEYKDLVAKAKEDSERYEKEMAEWNEKGFYTKADGTLSNAGVKK